MATETKKTSYKNYTKEELLKRVQELEKQIENQFKEEEKGFLVNFPWAGNLGQWYWYLDRNQVIFNDRKVCTLGYDPQEIGEIGFEFFTTKLHPDDYERVMDNMRRHLHGITDAYESEYRIQHKDGHYLWYYDRGTVTQKDENGKPLLLQGIVFDITESKKIEEQLRNLSERDVLTNFYNHRMFFEKITKYIEISRIQKTPFSLMMFDIDRFKKINDEFGHLVGDDVLRRISSLLYNQKRSNDLLFRYGGEEFFVIFPETDLEGALQASKRIHQSIQELSIPKVGNITVSMGIIEYRKPESIDEMVKRVDDLMYDAKKAGRNTIKY